MKFCEDNLQKNLVSSVNYLIFAKVFQALLLANIHTKNEKKQKQKKTPRRCCVKNATER